MSLLGILFALTQSQANLTPHQREVLKQYDHIRRNYACESEGLQPGMDCRNACRQNFHPDWNSGTGTYAQLETCMDWCDEKQAVNYQRCMASSDGGAPSGQGTSKGRGKQSSRAHVPPLSTLSEEQQSWMKEQGITEQIWNDASEAARASWQARSQEESESPSN